MTVPDLLEVLDQPYHKSDNGIAIKLVTNLLQKLGTSSCRQLVNRFVAIVCRPVTTCAFLRVYPLALQFITLNIIHFFMVIENKKGGQFPKIAGR